MSKEVNSIIQWWVVPHLPKEHIFIKSEGIILVKGSRSLAMEGIIEELTIK